VKQIPIQFVRAWQGRKVGQIDSMLSPGVAVTLIQHGFAKRHEQQHHRRRNRKPTVEQIAQPADE